ncbi:MAG: penicillin acylase family protein [Planctomycetes bacterium]|nr:penicillin acylase family protein [Planctomycetota bacterium]
MTRMHPIEIRGATRAIDAARDGAGVPHLSGTTWLDALYGLGYMHARDRGTQLLFARSVALGRAAEQIADVAGFAETDLLFRRIGLHLGLDEELADLTAESRDQLDVYSDGVNAGLADLGRTWPMWAVGFQGEPWDARSVVIVGRLLSFGGLAIGQWENERIVLELIHAGADEAALRELFAPRLDDVDFELLRKVRISNRLSDAAMEMLADLPRLAGSNAWALSGGRTASGSALLAADPHLEVNRLPAIWYECVLRWGDAEYVMGASLPGCPLFPVARARRLAWGVTHMKGDLLDSFIEDCREHDGRWQYRRGRRWLDFRVREETLGRKGSPARVERILENDVGSLLEDPSGAGPGYHLSLAWTGNRRDCGPAMAAWLDVIHAPATQDAMRVVLRSCHPALCWVFADADGRIGMQGSGRFPVRSQGYSGLTPIPAWDRANHWRGWLDPSALPSVIDPAKGFVATANEEQTAADGTVLVTQPAADYRLRRIRERLESFADADVRDMQAMQYDVVSPHADEILGILLPELPDGPVKRKLELWDRSFRPELDEPTLFFRFYLAVMMELLGHERAIGWRRMLFLCSRSGYSLMVLTAADRLLRRAASRWWRGESKQALVRRAAERAVARPLQRWSDVNHFRFTDRFFGGRRAGRFLGFDSRRLPMPGCHATLFHGHVLRTATRETTFAPSYHFVTDMSVDEAWTNLPGGPSENRFSKWYRSDIPRWLAGEYKRLAPPSAHP